MPAHPESPRALVAERLLALVSERTGYPVEMLDPQLDLEADLGIDSIKRVEILGSYRQRYGALEEVDLEQLTTRRTLQQVIDILAPAEEHGRAAPAPAPPAEATTESKPPAAPLAPAGAAYPLLGRLVSHSPEEELVAERVFDPAEDCYLRDHTLGQAVSTADPDLMALAVMPLTMSLEMVAEAAACLLPGRTVVGMRDIRAHRWLAWDGQPQTLRVTARRPRSARDRVMVQIRNLTEDQQSEEPPKSPVLEATVLLAEDYPPAPAPRLPRPAGARPSRWRPDQLYREVMFHGPSWQGVAAIDQTGDDGTLATLRVLPVDRFLRSNPQPRFVLDPVVLDAAGQVIGFWTVEHLPSGKVIFPFHVEALELYGPPRPAGETVACAAAIQLIGEQQVRSDIDMVAADGRLWMRLLGWEDKRFDLPPQFQPLLRSGGEAAISTPWPEPTASLPRPERLRCHRLDTALASDRGFWKRVWAMRVLGRSERELFRQLRTPEPRQIEWLAARTAGKEAVQHLLRARYGLDVPLADITIEPDERGRPLVGGRWREAVPGRPVLSLAHRDGRAVALAGLHEPDAGEEELHLGIDLERLRPPEEFAAVAFSAGEQQVLVGLPPDQREEWALRCWCAKEAVGKALGYGLVDGPGSVMVVAVDPARELVAAMLAGQIAAAYPRLAAMPLAVHTRRVEDVVVATTLCLPYHAEPAAGTPGRRRGMRSRP